VELRLGLIVERLRYVTATGTALQLLGLVSGHGLRADGCAEQAAAYKQARHAEQREPMASWSLHV
jgi:hypothetical protein